MKTKIKKWQRTIVETACVLFLVLAIVAASLYVNVSYDYQIGDLRRGTQIVATIILFAFCTGLCLFVGIVALGFTNYHKGSGFSILYPPIAMFVISLFAWLTIQAINAYDVIANEGVATSMLARGPEIAIFNAVLILCFVVVAPAWFLASALRRTGWTQLQVFMLFLLIAGATYIVYQIAARG